MLDNTKYIGILLFMSHSLDNPVERLINKFGTQKRLGQAAGVGQTTVSNWKRLGYVPAKKQQELLASAPSFGVNLCPDDFFAKPVGSPKSEEAA